MCGETPDSAPLRPTPLDQALAAAAGRQHGLLTRAQLTAAGVSETAISARLKAGRLHRVHRGVYAVGYRSSSLQTRAMAAVLACGPGAVLSHRSAAALWEIGPWRGPLEVTSPRDRRPRGIVAHRSRTLTPRDVTTQRGIPVTTVPRTLIDLAEVLTDVALMRVVNEARIRRRVQTLELTAAVTTNNGRRGAALLGRLVDLDGGPTRSVLEDRFVAFVSEHGLPPPRVNQRVCGHEVDMLWPDARLIVELDGRAFHDQPGAFERDRERDAQLTVAGYRVVRITWRRLAGDPDREAAQLRALLGMPGPVRPGE